MREECEYCINGHLEGCNSLDKAWDIGDLIAQSGCLGCCPNGCKPKGLQAEQDELVEALKRSFFLAPAYRDKRGKR
jgi:hypothetical protein